MTPIWLDASVLIVGILLFAVLYPRSPQSKTKPLKGSKIIVKAKAKNTIIHIGLIDHFDGDVAICYNAEGLMFAAWASHLFWSEGEQAFIERI